MTRKVYDVRIYPSPASGFDIILRVRGGIMKLENYPTIDAALDAARAVDGKEARQPVYVYDRSFSDLMAEALAPAISPMLKGAAE